MLFLQDGDLYHNTVYSMAAIGQDACAPGGTVFTTAVYGDPC